METEIMFVKLRLEDNKTITGKLTLYEKITNGAMKVKLELSFNSHTISCINDNYFSALLNLRKELEQNSVQILCNGSAKNLYPSPMQLSMGYGRLAYLSYNGQQAKKCDIVDIFDRDQTLDFVCIDEQKRYHVDWLKSLQENKNSY